MSGKTGPFGKSKGHLVDGRYPFGRTILAKLGSLAPDRMSRVTGRVVAGSCRPAPDRATRYREDPHGRDKTAYRPPIADRLVASPIPTAAEGEPERHRTLPAARCQRPDVLLLEEARRWGAARCPRAGPRRPPCRRHPTMAADFVPLSIIEPDPAAELEIELTNSCVLRLRGIIDPTLLRAAITAAGQLDGSREGAD